MGPGAEPQQGYGRQEQDSNDNVGAESGERRRAEVWLENIL
jgi:hypothetical protein